MTKVVVVVMVVMEIVMVVMEVVFSFTKSALVHSNLNISSPPIPAEIILYQTFLPSCNNFRPKLTNNSQSSSLGRLCWSCWCSSKQLVASWIWRRWWRWAYNFPTIICPPVGVSCLAVILIAFKGSRMVVAVGVLPAIVDLVWGLGLKWGKTSEQGGDDLIQTIHQAKDCPICLTKPLCQKHDIGNSWSGMTIRIKMRTNFWTYPYPQTLWDSLIWPTQKCDLLILFSGHISCYYNDDDDEGERLTPSDNAHSFMSKHPCPPW